MNKFKLESCDLLRGYQDYKQPKAEEFRELLPGQKNKGGENMRKLGKKLNQVERSVEAYTSCGCGCYCNEEPNYSYGTYMSQYTYTLAYYNR